MIQSPQAGFLAGLDREEREEEGFTPASGYFYYLQPSRLPFLMMEVTVTAMSDDDMTV